MTRRSEIRAAEMAVVNAADAMVTARETMQPLPPFHDELGRCVNDLRRLGLAYPNAVRSARNAPLTSEQAALFMSGDNVDRAIYRIVRHLVAITMDGDQGLTVEEAEVALRIKHQSASPRFTDLRDQGWIVDSGEERDTDSGVGAVVWKFSERARRLLGV